MFDRPPPESALWRLKHDELCIISIDGKEYEATWSAHTFRFCFKDENNEVRQPIYHAVDEWRPAGVRF